MPKGTTADPAPTGTSVVPLQPASPVSEHWQRAAVQEALANSLEHPADAKMVATAAVNVLQALFDEMERLLGHGAMRALFGRSLYLARASFPRPLAVPADGQGFLDPLNAELARRATQDAQDAAEALLVTFTELLTTFLGEPIAKRCLRSAWDGTATAVATRDKPK